jgi:hypothetical protein
MITRRISKEKESCIRADVERINIVLHCSPKGGGPNLRPDPKAQALEYAVWSDSGALQACSQPAGCQVALGAGLPYYKAAAILLTDA